MSSLGTCNSMFNPRTSHDDKDNGGKEKAIIIKCLNVAQIQNITKLKILMFKKIFLQCHHPPLPLKSLTNWLLSSSFSLSFFLCKCPCLFLMDFSCSQKRKRQQMQCHLPELPHANSKGALVLLSIPAVTCPNLGSES